MRFKNKSYIFYPVLIFFFLFFLELTLWPCTIAVVSGKATPDGRPLLWKNRDTTHFVNKILYIKGPKYAFLGNFNAEDKNLEEVWAGLNTKGFAIINASTPDLIEKEEGESQNGEFMQQALGTCANIPEFEKLLETTNGKRNVAAIFGVIDAQGNACFYETGNSAYVKFDANDPRVAPQGFIVRTNFAFTSPEEKQGGGFIRFERANRLFQAAAAEGRLDYKFIVQDVTRDLANDKIGSNPLFDHKTADPKFPFYINTNDTINRNSTVSSFIFHGAPSQDKEYLATMWVMLGQPICTISTPLWAASGEAPAVLGGEGIPELNRLALNMAGYLYPDQRGHMKQYLNITRYLNYGGQSFYKNFTNIERDIFLNVQSRMKQWDNKKPDQKEIVTLQNNTVALVIRALSRSVENLTSDR